MGRYLKSVFLLLVSGTIGLLTLLSCAPTEPLPMDMVSTTLNQDGISGHNFFQASWSLDSKTPEEVESLWQLVGSISEEIESDIPTTVIIWEWEDEYGQRLVLQTTVDFRCPSEIEGILAIIYGGGYGRSDISIKVSKPQDTDFKTVWFIEMTVNPDCIPSTENFVWKVNMPGNIESIEITPDEDSVDWFWSDWSYRAVTFTFEPQDRLITISIQAEKSKFGEIFIWPFLVGVVAGVMVTIVVNMLRHTWTMIRRKRHVSK